MSPARYVDHYRGERRQIRKTPREFFERLHGKYKFTLDGASSGENALLPKFSTEEDPVSWTDERVFCNPPWSNIRPFVELAPTAEMACLLVPARTNCKWFHRALELGAKPDYWLGKLSFDGPWNSPIDCLLLIWAEKPICECATFKIHSTCVHVEAARGPQGEGSTGMSYTRCPGCPECHPERFHSNDVVKAYYISGCGNTGHAQGQTPEPCPNCLGEKGEWIDRKDPRNSTYLQDNDEDEFIPCSYCKGTGERPTGREDE